MIILLLGPPGCGKGTQGERVAASLGIPKLSTGDVLRDAARSGTALGIQAQAYMEHGDLVPDAIIIGVMREALAAPAFAHGVILDGVVRTVAQADRLTTLFAELGRTLDAVLQFDIGDEELVKRLSGRTVCDQCQSPAADRRPGELHDDCRKRPPGKFVRRADDEPESVRNRLRVYRRQTKPVLDWYRGNGACVIAIDAVGPVEHVATKALAAVRKVMASA